MRSESRLVVVVACGAAWLTLTTAGHANPLMGALGETKFMLDTRVRYERVEQLGVADSADALLLRARLGLQTGKAWNTSLLAEVEAVGALDDNYRADNSVAGVHTNFPVIADPRQFELNRLQLTNTSLAGTTMTLGRQRIILDDQRFVGTAGWRMNEQTVDALRVANTSIPRLSIDVSYLWRVNRIYGDDSPQSAYRGNSYLANVAYLTPLGKLTGFGYLLDFNPIVIATGAGVSVAQAAGLNPIRASTSTVGGRFAGERPLGRIRLGYALSYASQTARGQNPLLADNHYHLAELTATWRQWSLGAGDETLSGNGTVGFSTPLATLHKFQGWVDKFLTTPANGIKDRYATLAWSSKGVGPFDTVAATAVYHAYDAEHVALDYGSELNLQCSAKFHRYTGLIKYGKYQSAASTPITVARDTRKYWVQLEYLY